MKKWVTTGLLAAALVTSLATFTGCGKQSGDNAVIASYSGKQITQSQFYKQLKAAPTSKTVLANMLIYGAMDHAYGKKIDEKKVDSAYNAYKQQYGGQFKSYLSQNNFTQTSFKQTIRLNYLSAAALRDQMKPTTAQLQAAWKTYQPKIEVAHILTTSQDTAKQVISKLQSGASFAKLAENYSVDNATNTSGGKLPAFDSTDKTLDSTFKTAAYKLKDGQITSSPVKTTGGYEVIKMLDHKSKGSFAANKASLTNTVYGQWERSSTVMHNVTSKVLKQQKVKIKDADLKDALATYQNTSAGSSSSATK